MPTTTTEVDIIYPIYEIVEDNWGLDRTNYYIQRNGVEMTQMQLGMVNSFKTLELAIEQLEKMKFKPTKKVVYTDSF